jgi:hypothetical protein
LLPAAEETFVQFTKLHMLLFCHSGLDPESIVFSGLSFLDAGSSPA